MDKELLEGYENFKALENWDKALNCLLLINDYPMIKGFRDEITKKIYEGDTNELLPLVLKRAYFHTAKDHFEDYLIAVEWNRPYKEKFYLPRKKYLSPLVEAYQEVADGKIHFLAVSLVKRGGKSQLGINFTNFLSGKYPNRSTLMEGAGDALINSFYQGSLEYFNDPAYSFYDIFPTSKVVQTNADLHTVNLQSKSRFPTIMCRSIDATQVGLSEATNLLYLDDCVEGYVEAQNRRRLDEKWASINGDVLGRALEGTPIVACGTRYSIYDPIGRLIDKAIENNWNYKVVSVPALNDNDESNYEFYNPKLGRKQFTAEFFINERKTLSPQQWEAEFQQQPFEAKGVLFPDKELNRFYELPIGIEPDGVLAVCDTAEGKGDSTSMPIGYIYGEDVYIPDVVFSKAVPAFTKPEVAQKLVKWKVTSAVFESNLAGQYFATDVDKLVKDMGGRCSIRTRRTVTNKQTRMELASDYITKHFYFLDKSMYASDSEYGRFMKEVTQYTREGKVAHDDAPDSLSLFENILREMYNAKIEIRSRIF